MITPMQSNAIQNIGLNNETANELSEKINQCLAEKSPIDAWHTISKKILTPDHPFQLHLIIFKQIFPDWPNEPEKATAWIPENTFLKNTHLARAMNELHFNNYKEFHEWSTNHFERFWEFAIKKLAIVFQKQPEKIIDLSQGIASPKWLPGAEMNIAESCFTADPNKTAILFQNEQSKNDNNKLQKLTYGQLNQLSNRIANSLISNKYIAGDAIAIDMPMTQYAVAIYLGIVKMGGVVVSIADSFSAEEIETRLRLANAKAIFTQDFILRDKKKLPLLERVKEANSPPAIVIPCEEKISIQLRQNDLTWEQFLLDDDKFDAVARDPMSHCNILFSSGTTGEPKAIPWNHTTPIKVASDAYFHQNIEPDDVLAWPTNLGWMMGPWLIFAALINQATIALFDGLPRDRAFGKFVQDAEVTMLGVVPTLVASWRQSQCMEGLNWQAIKVFSSTGECSNPEDMLYLMHLADYKPVIEYCGGTEIGGAYLTNTLVENNSPSVFTTPTLGLDLILLDETGQPSDNGEVALIPPSIGLSTELLNANHQQVYFDNMPKTPDGKILRRHGDQIRQFVNGNYSVLGRADDTMNLGGIKISSAEIERSLKGIEDITETAAIAISSSGHGPSQLVIYATTQKKLDPDIVKKAMQQRINQHLNPLFKIYEVVFVSELPKTASNKIMRRLLRTQYSKQNL